METKRRLKKIGGSVALFIPPEKLEELRLEPGAEVEVTSGARSRVSSGGGGTTLGFVFRTESLFHTFR